MSNEISIEKQNEHELKMLEVELKHNMPSGYAINMVGNKKKEEN